MRGGGGLISWVIVVFISGWLFPRTARTAPSAAPRCQPSALLFWHQCTTTAPSAFSLFQTFSPLAFRILSCLNRLFSVKVRRGTYTKYFQFEILINIDVKIGKYYCWWEPRIAHRSWHRFATPAQQGLSTNDVQSLYFVYCPYWSCIHLPHISLQSSSTTTSPVHAASDNDTLCILTTLLKWAFHFKV